MEDIKNNRSYLTREHQKEIVLEEKSINTCNEYFTYVLLHDILSSIVPEQRGPQTPLILEAIRPCLLRSLK